MENLFSKPLSSAGSNGRLTFLLGRSNFLLSSPVLVRHPLCCEFYCLQLMIAQYLLFVPWCGHSWNCLTQTGLFWGEIVVCIQEKQWFVAFHRAWFLFCRARPELTSDEPCLRSFFQATWGGLIGFESENNLRDISSTRVAYLPKPGPTWLWTSLLLIWTAWEIKYSVRP